MHGIHLAVADGRVWWSAVDSEGADFTSTQSWGDHEFLLVSKGGEVRASVGGRQVFTITAGTRVVSDLAGQPLKIVGVSPRAQEVTLTLDSAPRKFTIQPNQVIPVGAANADVAD